MKIRHTIEGAGITTRKRVGILMIVFLIGALTAGCGNDGFDQSLAMDQTAGGSLLLSMVPDLPVPGNSGIITTAGITGSSAQLVWIRATSSASNQNQLRYKIVRSLANNIRTVSEAELNGIVVRDWTTNITTIIALGLNPASTHYFNVIVVDTQGRMAAYNPVAAVTLGDAVYMFSAGSMTARLWDNTQPVSARDQVDAVCSAVKQSSYPALACGQVRALVSLSAADAIVFMGANYVIPTVLAVKSAASGSQIAANWSDLTDGTIGLDLMTANVANGFWWSGSTPNGAYNAGASCNAWTDDTNASTGIVGATNKTTINWIAEGASNCNTPAHLLCVCW